MSSAARKIRGTADVAGALMLVPSIIVPEEYNVLINPAHPSTAQLTSAVTRQYIHDPRL
jgi:RES domain-containing protein